MAGLLDSVDQVVTPHVAGQLSKLLGIDEAQVHEGVKLASPLVLGAVVRKTATPEGADAMTGMLQTPDSDLLGNVAGVVTSSKGDELVDMLFGAGANKAAATVHDATGFDIAPFLPVAVPILLGLLQKTVTTQKLDSAGLATLVKTENDDYAKANPLLSQQIHAALEAGEQVVKAAEVNRARFTDAEWDTLTHAPSLAGFAVMMSSMNGPLGMTREVEALVDSMGEVEHEAPGDSLVGLVSHEFKTPEQLNALGANHTNAGLMATDMSKQAVAILHDKATEQEQYEYKVFVMNVALRVAEASKEGGFLGIGGVLINDKEQSMLDHLSDALGYRP